MSQSLTDDDLSNYWHDWFVSIHDRWQSLQLLTWLICLNPWQMTTSIITDLTDMSQTLTHDDFSDYWYDWYVSIPDRWRPLQLLTWLICLNPWPMTISLITDMTDKCQSLADDDFSNYWHDLHISIPDRWPSHLMTWLTYLNPGQMTTSPITDMTDLSQSLTTDDSPN